ncbi:NIPSNAP family protein [Nocardia sp. CA-119907]|uniref:NIPSNAP family protein n=1 Tax=Nocardia sp. CA-119907 TaxID=3239973 RepID=UPI003D9A04EB
MGHAVTIATGSDTARWANVRKAPALTPVWLRHTLVPDTSGWQRRRQHQARYRTGDEDTHSPATAVLGQPIARDAPIDSGIVGMVTQTHWPVVELRQYTLRPGSRDALIDLFDREFVETQEAVGIRVIAQFRDEDDPDRFVWIRAFRDMTARTASLTAFYIDGAAWQTHAAAARATMVDTTNALLLHPATPTSGFSLSADRPGVEATVLPQSRVLATIYHPDIPTGEFAEFFDSRVRPVLEDTGAALIGSFVTEPALNTFAMLPIRTETVFVSFALFENAGRLDEHLDVLARSPVWAEQVQPALSKRLSEPVQQLRLAPTARSLLR